MGGVEGRSRGRVRAPSPNAEQHARPKPPGEMLPVELDSQERPSRICLRAPSQYLTRPTRY